jgi:hypothetical protein
MSEHKRPRRESTFNKGLIGTMPEGEVTERLMKAKIQYEVDGARDWNLVREVARDNFADISNDGMAFPPVMKKPTKNGISKEATTKESRGKIFDERFPNADSVRNAYTASSRITMIESNILAKDVMQRTDVASMKEAIREAYANPYYKAQHILLMAGYELTESYFQSNIDYVWKWLSEVQESRPNDLKDSGVSIESILKFREQDTIHQTTKFEDFSDKVIHGGISEENVEELASLLYEKMKHIWKQSRHTVISEEQFKEYLRVLPKPGDMDRDLYQFRIPHLDLIYLKKNGDKWVVDKRFIDKRDDPEYYNYTTADKIPLLIGDYMRARRDYGIET